MSNFISPAELSSIMDDVIILDARGFHDYKKGHVQGAFPVDIEKDLSGPVGEHGGRHPLPNMDQLASRLETFGITTESKVVIYDSWLLLAGRLWWLLRYMGLTDVRVLAGGIERWVREGYPLTKDPTPLVQDAAEFNYTLQDHMVMSRDEVLEASNSQSHVIIDARSPERYSGIVPDTMDGMTGHIPGAINHFYESGYTAAGPRTTEELHDMYLAAMNDGRPIVTYCGSGVTACNAMLTMHEVGIESALYVGSSSDWVTYDDSPIQRGVETLG